MKRGVQERTAQSIAQKISSFLQDACGDMAVEAIRHPGEFGEVFLKKFKAAKKAGCKDLHGWAGDELYNTSDLLVDLIGDRLCEATYDNKALRNEVLDILGKGHTAQRIAVAELRRD